MQAPRLRIFTEDARPFLRRTDERYDAILVDAYRQPYIPFYMSTKEFFELARDRLRPGGRVIINVGHPEDSDTLEKVLTATMGEAFASVVRVPAEATNTILVGGDRSLTPGSLGRRSRACRPICSRARGPTRTIAAPGLRGGSVYTDDKAPVEWLVDASLVQVATDGDER